MTRKRKPKNPINPGVVQKGAGRVGYYREDIAERAYHLCLLGLSNRDLAVAFGVKLITIELWTKSKPEFNDALQRGRAEADSQVVAALFKKAIGFKYRDDLVQVYKTQKVTEHKDGSKTTEEIFQTVTVPVVKHQHPDTGAMIFWLCNRQRDYWKNTQRVEHSGRIDHQHEIVNNDLSDLSDIELKALQKAGLGDLLQLKEQN